MRLKFFMVSTLFFIIFLFWSVDVYSAPRNTEEIFNSGQLRICYTAWRGADTEEDMQSPFMEIAKSFAEYLNLEPVTKKIQWDQQFVDKNEDVKQGASYTPYLFDEGVCDLFANNLGNLPWREKLMKFNWFYNGIKVVVILRKNKTNFKDINDLAGKKTVVVQNTTYHEWLLEYNQTRKNPVQIRIEPSGGTLTYLLNGQADFIVLESTLALYSKAHINQEIEIAFSVGDLSQVGWGFPTTNSDLLELSNGFFSEQSDDELSSVNLIFKKYFGVTLKEFNRLQYLIL